MTELEQQLTKLEFQYKDTGRDKGETKIGYYSDTSADIDLNGTNSIFLGKSNVGKAIVDDQKYQTAQNIEPIDLTAITEIRTES